jgi:DNA excision repair protein ERCC-4
MRANVHYSDFTAVIDTREQHPFDLKPMQTVPGTLNVGDYSIFGLESVIAIERKSLPDLVACCGRERERFQRELDRLRGWPVSAVVIECSWEDIQSGDWRSQLTPGQVRASLESFIAQGHCIVMGGNRKTASKLTRGILFYAARYRWREARAMVACVQQGDQLQNVKKENRPAATDRLSN